jgi:glycosyltransferase involved in cell wall biosynthesis
MLPTVSVIIPCRNEEKFIDECLRSIIETDFPLEDLEVIVVDGMSEDRTRRIAAEILEEYPFIKLMDNPNKIVSSALNIGIQAARGRIIMRMDAHARYEKNYIRKCVEHMETSGADNVGGVCITVSSVDTPVAQAIAMALSHPFGVGNAYFRIGSSEPRYVDTVPFGCYRRKVFDEIGFFDEDLIRNQDDEFNLRLIKNGGKILLVPEILVNYVARDSLFKLWRMYYQYGYFKPLVALKLGSVLTWRQLIPPLFVSMLGLTAILSLVTKYAMLFFFLLICTYAITSMVFAYKAGEKNGWRCVVSLFFVFPVLHFSYGIGYLKGIIDFVILKRSTKKRIAELPISR